ncbi:MAG: alpha/beta fold hydrolase [Candidatus Eisenbacteria bacterium]|uniref:Alpha/beta fold hydrolase n=1 Tax=Eiseniibacteriota bacterium TaxID=2212470 RepID=A0A538TGI2_UNCEI|nr:MAG: alpha/beta fold hydrolase [Candidatus Eisenbacteria bacterium]
MIMNTNVDSRPVQDVSTVLQVAQRITQEADKRNWGAMRESFAPRVVLDYGTPELLTPEEIVARWKPLLSEFDQTEHSVLIDGVRKEQESARVSATFRASHRMDRVAGGDEWVLNGRYDYELMQFGGSWKVTRMRMTPGESTGNARLLDEAKARAGLPGRPTPPYSVDHVSFKSRGDELTGLLYRPREGDSRLPAIVVTGSWTTVKEQMPAVYAERLAAAGYAALTFDFRGYGESEGEPRHFESPKKKVEDIRSAVDFLASSNLVDGGRIGLLGVCASAGYAAEEAASDERVRAIALVAPWLHDAELAESVYGGREVYGGKGAAALTTVGRRAAERYMRDGILDTVPAASTTDPRAAMYWPDPGFLDYYLNPLRGGIPQWGNRYAVASWPEWLGYNAIASAPRLRKPTLLVHSEQGAIPDGVRRYAAAMPVAPEIKWMAGTQFHFYDDPETVAAAVAEVVAHFGRTL